MSHGRGCLCPPCSRGVPAPVESTRELPADLPAGLAEPEQPTLWSASVPLELAVTCRSCRRAVRVPRDDAREVDRPCACGMPSSYRSATEVGGEVFAKLWRNPRAFGYALRCPTGASLPAFVTLDQLRELRDAIETELRWVEDMELEEAQAAADASRENRATLSVVLVDPPRGSFHRLAVQLEAGRYPLSADDADYVRTVLRLDVGSAVRIYALAPGEESVEVVRG